MSRFDFPIAVVGAGPIGVVAAAHIIARGGRPLVLERGDAISANVREWSHVKLFSPWKWIIDPLAQQFLTRAGYAVPDPEAVPTGAELLSEFVEPLGQAISIQRYLLRQHDVKTITKSGGVALSAARRAQSPFELKAETPHGTVSLLAQAVIDASGTWRTPNPLGADGLPAIGEAEHVGAICYRIPDVLGRERDRFQARRVAVVGGGHSAANLLIDLATLNRESGRTTWVLRNPFDPKLYGLGDADALTRRAHLGQRVRALVETRRIQVEDSFPIFKVVQERVGVTLHTAGGDDVGPFDQVIAATGFTPDHSITAELNVEYDSHLGCPVLLASKINPATHPCGTDFLHGHAYLAHPEPNFFTVGMKSYGRAPSFDLLTGCEQVRSVVALLMGDVEAANRIEAVYPTRSVASNNCAKSQSPETTAACRS